MLEAIGPGSVAKRINVDVLLFLLILLRGWDWHNLQRSFFQLCMVKRPPGLCDDIICFVNVVDLVLKEHDSLLGLFPVCEFLDHFVYVGQPRIEVLDNLVELVAIDLAADFCL